MLDVDRERRLQRLLKEALSLPSEQRRGHMIEAAGDDPSLAEEALALLSSSDQLGAFLERPAAVDQGYLASERSSGEALAEAGQEEPDSPPSIADYEVLERLGSGGMGEVFRVLQERPVPREVALKRIRANLPQEARERFLVEQRALARLSHTNVARFYDAGTDEDGHPFFVMELVPGLPVTAYCDKHRLSIEERLRIFLDVCAGVEHAHQRQILHRDLKPSNVLVVEESGRPVPKVIDFGIAKSLEPSASGLTLETGAGLLGTPAYMSPEALEPGRRGDGVDTRSDVYSLGVLLHELLTGQTPFDDGDPGFLELIRRIETGTTEAPSDRLRRYDAEDSEAVAARRGTTGRELVRTVRSDLDWIVSRAIAAERERRYASVGELAKDVARFLADEPVEARPPSVGYRLAKLVRRHRSAAVVVAAVLTGLVLGVVGLAYGLLEARHEASAAREALEQSKEVSNFLTGLFDASRPGSKPADEITAEELLDRGAADLETRLRDRPLARARLLRSVGDVYVQLGHYDQARALLDEAEKLLRAELPDDHPDVAAVLRSQGVLAFHRSDFKRAEELLRQGARGLDAKADAEDRALAVHNLGVVLLSEGRLEEARAQLERALEIRERELPPDHPHFARSYNALGTVALQEGKMEEAQAFFQRAVEHLERTLGPGHAYVALALKNLAIAQRGLGRYDDAVASLDRAIAIQEKTLGPMHPDLAEPLMTLGLTLAPFRDPVRAEAAFRRVLEIRIATLGEDNPEVGTAERVLGTLLAQHGRYDEAEPLLRACLEIEEREGEPAQRLVLPRMYLGLAALEHGRLDEAEAALEQSLEAWERDLGPTHRNVSWPLLGLARIHRDRGDLTEADRLAQRALAIREQAYPADHPWVQEAKEIAESIRTAMRREAPRRE